MAVTVLVDTSVIVAGPETLAGREAEAFAISVVTVGELQAGVLRAPDQPRAAVRLRRLAALLESTPVLVADRRVATRYGELRAATGRRPSNDLWIAATALAHDLELLTADERQSRLPLVRTRLLS